MGKWSLASMLDKKAHHGLDMPRNHWTGKLAHPEHIPVVEKLQNNQKV